MIHPIYVHGGQSACDDKLHARTWQAVCVTVNEGFRHSICTKTARRMLPRTRFVANRQECDQVSKSF